MRKKIDEKKWRDILSEISENVTEVSYRSWFSPLVPLEIDEEAAVIYFATSKKQVTEVLEMRYIPLFERAVESIYSRKYKVVVKYKTERLILCQKYLIRVFRVEHSAERGNIFMALQNTMSMGVSK